ncbi:MAG: peroxiredoxin family protein [Mucilaginibacter sp.]
MKSYITKIFTGLSIVSAAIFSAAQSNAAAKPALLNDTTVMQHWAAQPADVSPLLTGEQIPAVRIPAADGKLFDLNDHVAQKPTILVFYRGGWCPFCNKELAGLQGIQQDLVKLGYQIIAISTDSPENLNKSIGKHQLSYTLLSDADLNITKQFGLAFKAPKDYDQLLVASSGGKNTDRLLPVPSVFILDQKGTIRYEYINPDFKQRISPNLLQSVAKAIKDDNAGKTNEGN